MSILEKATPSPQNRKIPFEKRLVIKYLSKSNIVLAKGRSTGLELLPIYTRLISKIIKHFRQSDKISCYFDYAVINATTTKMLCNLLAILEKAARKGKQIVVYWIIDEGDEDLLFTGNLLQEIYQIDFRITVR